EIELINLELPILEEGDQINTIALYFKNDIDASIHLKIPQEPSNYPRISGKTWLCIGDSITAGVGGFSYEYQAQRYIPTLKFYNIATSGASVCDNSVSPRAWATFAQQQINNKNYFPDYIDLITIALGVNDRKPETVIGTLTDIASDTNNTFYARYKHLIVTLMIRYPFADIVLITPFRTSENPYIKSWGTDPNKFSALDLAKAVKGIGEYFNLHVIDLMSGGGGFYPAKRDDLPRLQNDRWDKFTVDSLHPNDVGHYYLMKRILGELEKDLL
ncbi:MAG: SGNH/GDSL hydrolase family protein, partial [Peptostreptococcaceae bacterium]